MQPKNSGERKKGFISFLLLFLLSTAIIVLLAFSSTQVPLKHNTMLQKQIEVSDHEKEFSKNFMQKMTGVVSLLDTINTVGVSNPDLIDGQISTAVGKLSGTAESDSVYNKEFYVAVTQLLVDLQRAKRQLRMNAGAGTDIDKCNQLNESLNNQLEQVKSKRDELQLKVMELLNK